MNNVRKILAIELYISSTEILEKENLKSTKIIQSICEKIKECIVNKESLGEKIDLISNFLEENEF